MGDELHLDEHERVDEPVDDDHGGGRPGLTEDLGVGCADRVRVTGVAHVHPGLHDVAGLHADAGEGVEGDAEGAYGLARRRRRRATTWPSTVAVQPAVQAVSPDADDAGVAEDVLEGAAGAQPRRRQSSADGFERLLQGEGADVQRRADDGALDALAGQLRRWL